MISKDAAIEVLGHYEPVARVERKVVESCKASRQYLVLPRFKVEAQDLVTHNPVEAAR